MKRNALSLVLLLTLVLCGCAITPENVEPEIGTDSNVTSNAPPVFEDGANEYIVNDDYVLIETKRNSNATRFDLWNKETNELENLPLMADYATVKEIINENCIIFTATGQNSESISLDFPYYIKCFRVDDGQDIFWRVDESKRFDLSEIARAGSDRESVLKSVDFSHDSIDLHFGPTVANDPEYYADIADIPLTNISYNSQARSLDIELKDCFQNNECLVCDDILNYSPHITSYKISEVENGLRVSLYLSDLTTSYFAKKTLTPNPCLSVQLW